MQPVGRRTLEVEEGNVVDSGHQARRVPRLHARMHTHTHASVSPHNTNLLEFFKAAQHGQQLCFAAAAHQLRLVKYIFKRLASAE